MYEPEIVFRADKETNPKVDVTVWGIGESKFVQSANDFISLLFITNQHDAVVSMGKSNADTCAFTQHTEPP